MFHTSMNCADVIFFVPKKLHTATSIINFLFQIFTYFFESKAPDSNRRLCRIITKEFTSKSLTSMITIDQRYLILSGYMLHRHISFLFYNTMKGAVYVNGLHSHYTFIMLFPYCLFYDASLPCPPRRIRYDNTNSTWIVTMSCIILFVSILQILQFKVKKLFSSFNTRFTILPLNITISCSLARYHIYASICLTTNDKKVLNTMNFGLDSAIFIVGKSANTHIWTI